MSQDLIASGRLRVGVNRQDSVDVAERTIAENATRAEKYFELYAGNTLGPGFAFGKARGTAAAPSNVQQDDELGTFYFKAYSNSMQNTAAVAAAVDAAVVAGQRPASRLIFQTNANNAAPRLVGYFSNQGYLGIGTAFNPAISASRAAHPVHIVASGTGAECYITAENYGSGADENVTIRLGRARGTFAAPTTIVTGDVVGEYEFWAYTNQWHHCAEIVSNVEGTVVAGTTPDTNLFLNTTFGGNIRPRIKIFSSAPVAIGDATGQTLATAAANSVGGLWIGYNDSSAPLGLHRASADSGSPALYFRKSRGTLAAPATVANGDELMYIQGSAYTNAWHDNVGAISIVVDAAVVAGQRPASRIEFRTNVSGAGGPTTYMQVLSTGTIYIGSTGTPETTRALHLIQNFAGAVAKFENTNNSGSANGVLIKGGHNSTTGSKLLIFNRPDNTEIGNVTQNAAGTVAYNTSSDARLKADIQDSDMGLPEVLQIRPRRFRYKTDPTNRVLHGFIAQELAAIFPEAVTMGSLAKDCNCDLDRNKVHDPDCCNSIPWGVDYGKLTPLLVRAVQQIAERLVILENR